jgi:tripartite-type tricarboxylate transporter receptor subunit TctC
VLPRFGSAQGDWPRKTGALVVPFAPGGSSEIVGRTAAAELTRILGQNVFVDNKPGAPGTSQWPKWRAATTSTH